MHRSSLDHPNGGLLKYGGRQLGVSRFVNFAISWGLELCFLCFRVVAALLCLCCSGVCVASARVVAVVFLEELLSWTDTRPVQDNNYSKKQKAATRAEATQTPTTTETQQSSNDTKKQTNEFPVPPKRKIPKTGDLHINTLPMWLYLLGGVSRRHSEKHPYRDT